MEDIMHAANELIAQVPTEAWVVLAIVFVVFTILSLVKKLIKLTITCIIIAAIAYGFSVYGEDIKIQIDEGINAVSETVDGAVSSIKDITGVDYVTECITEDLEGISTWGESVDRGLDSLDNINNTMNEILEEISEDTGNQVSETIPVESQPIDNTGTVVDGSTEVIGSTDSTLEITSE